MKLKNVLIIAFIIASAVPVYLSIQYLNSYTAQQYRAQIKDKLAALSSIAKKRILAVIDRVEDNTILVSSRTQMRLELDQWNRTHDPAYRDTIQNVLTDASLRMQELNEIAIYDPDGRFVISTDSEAGQSELVNLPMENLSVRLDRAGDRLYLESISRLILNNSLVGFLKLNFSANFILDLVNDRAGLGDSGEWLFAIRSPDGDAMFAVPLKYDQNAAFRRTVSKDSLDVPITQALLGNEIIMSNTPDYVGQPVLASTRYITEQDWGLVVKINEDEINNFIASTNRILFILEVIIIMLSLVIGAVLSVYIARPIENLRSHTRKIAAGDYAKQPVPRAWQEARDLTDSFNKMAESLKELNDDLNQKVKLRTQELENAYQKLKEIAIRDPLTGIYNRRFIDERLNEECNRAKRYSIGLTLTIFDIDHFKSINDTHGHAAGDEVLRVLAVYLKQRVRDFDIVGRIGGEEFCIIFSSHTSDKFLPVIEKI